MDNLSTISATIPPKVCITIKQSIHYKLTALLCRCGFKRVAIWLIMGIKS